MPQQVWESVKLTGEHLIDRARDILHEGNVRQISVKQGSRTVAVFPLTIGLVGAVAAPVLAAVGAIVALMTDCTIEIERRADGDGPAAVTPPRGQAAARTKRRATTRAPRAARKP